MTYGSQGTYNGFDRFGRVVDQLWADDTFDPVDEYKYGYDLVGNRTSKGNMVAPNTLNLDEKYAYDEVFRLIGTDRGAFDQNGVFTKASDYQDWGLDGLGNFSTFNDNGTTQTRTVNAANEIQTLTGGQGTPLYDAAGNLTTDGARNYKYDAWNRQVKVTTGTGETLKEKLKGTGAILFGTKDAR